MAIEPDTPLFSPSELVLLNPGVFLGVPSVGERKRTALAKAALNALFVLVFVLVCSAVFFDPIAAGAKAIGLSPPASLTYWAIAFVAVTLIFFLISGVMVVVYVPRLRRSNFADTLPWLPAKVLDFEYDIDRAQLV